MGTYLCLWGEPAPAPDKQEELARRIQAVFTRGGMMQAETVSMFGRRLSLLHPPEPQPGSGDIPVYVNYFEDDAQETAGYSPKNGRLWSGKVGWYQFSWVLAAAYLQEELLSETPCFTQVSGMPTPILRAAGWLNHLFDEQYDLHRRREIAPLRDVLLAHGFRDTELFEFLPEDDPLRRAGELPQSRSGPFSPIPPVTTAEFLHISEDDMLYFWRQDNGIHLSPSLWLWLADLRQRYIRYRESGFPMLDGSAFLRDFITTLADVNKHYTNLHPFRDMFYEFLAHSQERHYQAMWQLFKDVVRETWDAAPDLSGKALCLLPRQVLHNAPRRKVKRCLALLANRDLRDDLFQIKEEP